MCAIQKTLLLLLVAATCGQAKLLRHETNDRTSVKKEASFLSGSSSGWATDPLDTGEQLRGESTTNDLENKIAACLTADEAKAYRVQAAALNGTDEGLPATHTACSLRRATALVVHQLNSDDTNAFETMFAKEFPECVDDSKALVLTPPETFVSLGTVPFRRRLYSQCGIGSSGDYTISANCSITSTITVGSGQTLKITGVGTEKPAIDGGWDGVAYSGTGVRLFDVETGGTLIIDNMILTNGEVSIRC